MARSTRKTTASVSTSRKGAATPPRDPELKRLTRRLADLTLAYVAAGKATPALTKTVAALRADVDAWRRTTGRRDFRAVKTRMRQQGDDGWTCAQCEWIMTSMGRVCFLVECDPEWNMCGYICFTFPKDPGPVS